MAMRAAFSFLAAALLAPAAAQSLMPSPPRHVPVLRENFPDPFVLNVGGQFIAYSTNHANRNLPVAASRDLVRWRMLGEPKNPAQLRDAFPTLPRWAQAGFTWAPEVLALGDRYLLYFTARHRASGRQCVGVAEAKNPLGPFRSSAPEPLVCQLDEGGTIDASPFRDRDGELYFYYKNDGNNPAVAKPTFIYGQRLSADGLRLEGAPVRLLRNDTHWEWRVVEAPAMVRGSGPGGGYAMFFSGNHFGWEADQRLSNYSIGYATCRGPLGPCQDAAENPILHAYNDARGCLSGPGHANVFEAGGRPFVAFHAWDSKGDCRKGEHARHLYVAPLVERGGKWAIGPSLRAAK